MKRSDVDLYCRDGKVWLHDTMLFSIDTLKIVGDYNVCNAMIAACMAYRMGVSIADIQAAAASFTSVEHRLEYIGEANGVRFYNDSKATNTHAAAAALSSFASNIILLAGGHDKGIPFDDLKRFDDRVKLCVSMDVLEILKSIFYGIVEGITEWLPISSTGHMILLEEILPMNVSASFWEVFLVVVQLGAILAVVLLYWKKLFPLNLSNKNRPLLRYDILQLWFKILVACIPAAIVGLLFDDWLNEHLYHSVVVAIMLILVGLAFLFLENRNRYQRARVTALSQITYRDALIIGIFQLIAAIFPGTSRSGATIIGALMIGVSRTIAAEFTFFLAIPVMFGASLLKLVKFGLAFSGMELGLLFVGMLSAFIVSLLVIRFLMAYIKKHDFKVFGYYRIALGIVVLAFFLIF